MFARLASGQALSGKLTQAIKIWEEKDSPLKQSLKGYRGAYALSDHKTGKMISLTFWDTEEEAIAYEKSAENKKIVDMYKDILTVEYAQLYEISAQDKI